MNAVAVTTRQSLAEDFARLGAGMGDVLLVHASMRSLGYVVGGARTVVDALFDVIGQSGTLVVPTFTPESRDPERWTHRRLPPELWPTIRQNLPAFDRDRTPSIGMGAIAECVRTWPSAVRSDHPQTSFAAIGPHAVFVTDDHKTESPLGEQSPLARLENLNAKILLLGVGLEKCTAFHLAEYRIPNQVMYENSYVSPQTDTADWALYETVLLNDHDFVRLGADFESQSGSVTQATVGAANGRIMRVREAVQFAEDWIPRHRAVA